MNNTLLYIKNEYPLRYRTKLCVTIYNYEKDPAGFCISSTISDTKLSCPEMNAQICSKSSLKEKPCKGTITLWFAMKPGLRAMTEPN